MEERRRHEDDLLASYHSKLVAREVADYPPQELRDDYRRAILFCFTYPMSAAGQTDVSDPAPSW